MNDEPIATKPEWVKDETGAWRRAVKPRMGRRCRNWDYKGRGVYLITIAAKDRGRGVWGKVEILPASGQAPTTAGLFEKNVRAEPLAARFIPNAAGEIIARAWSELAENWPITRASACTLNRIAQLIAGPGAAQIDYRGMKVADIDRVVAEVTAK